MPVTSFAGAPCKDDPDLFASTAWAAHREARKICQTCPRLKACEAEVADVGREYATGTWAGELYGKRGTRPLWLLQEAG